MKSIRLISYVVLLSIFFTNAGCKKSDKCCSPEPNQPYTAEYVTATVTGRVTDENNLPVSGAAVKAGSLTATTDVNGNFSIANANLDKQAGFVKVEKDGFFQGSRTISVIAGATHTVAIQLIKKVVAGTVSSTSGGSVTVPSGGSISFTDNSFINPVTNAAYSGTVSVNAFFINPTASNINTIMPGALMGITDNFLSGLKSYGMMAVELTGASGEKLQLTTGKQATITFPIPAGLQSQAPAEINLWSFDEAMGLWKQESTATKNGNNYIAKVGHFSFWNCDASFPIVNIKATLRNKDGVIVPSARVTLNIKDDNVVREGYTDNAGMIWGPVPYNKTLTMKVYNICGDIIHTQDIGPFTGDFDLGAILINATAPTSVTISGVVVNCTGNVITNGQVNISVNNKNYRALISGGSFSVAIDRCDNSALTAKIQAFDFDATQQGAETNLSIGSGNVVDAGQLSACGSAINEYINYFYGGTQVILIPPDYFEAARGNDTTGIVGSHQNQTGFTNFIFKGAPAPGTYALSKIYFIANQSSWNMTGTANVTITEYGPVGGYIAGSFSGNVLRTSTTVPVPVTGRFRVKRSQ